MKAIVATILILVGLFIALVIAVESCSGGFANDETLVTQYPANTGEASLPAQPSHAESIQYGDSEASSRRGYAALPDTGGVRIWP